MATAEPRRLARFAGVLSLFEKARAYGRAWSLVPLKCTVCETISAQQQCTNKVSQSVALFIIHKKKKFNAMLARTVWGSKKIRLSKLTYGTFWKQLRYLNAELGNFCKLPHHRRRFFLLVPKEKKNFPRHKTIIIVRLDARAKYWRSAQISTHEGSAALALGCVCWRLEDRFDHALYCFSMRTFFLNLIFKFEYFCFSSFFLTSRKIWIEIEAPIRKKPTRRPHDFTMSSLL